ncbi:MAG: FAD-dependent oxidoreductase [Clostridia bacterium]|nr:FAD-dependent oxidoreductase [Clostridia bacterium]
MTVRKRKSKEGDQILKIQTHETVYDLIVVGGGLTGCAAALAAARNGKQVLLVERINALGGAPSTMTVNPFMPYTTRIPETGETKLLSRGIFEELVNALRAEDAMFYNAFNPEWMKIILNRKMEEAGVRLLFNHQLIDAERTGNRVNAVLVAGKAGVLRLKAAQFIDCTGDADLAFMAGFPCRLGRPEDGLCQPMTLNFLVGNVDIEEFEKHTGEILSLWAEEKKIRPIRNPMDGIMLFRTTVPSILRLNATRVVKKNPVDPWELTEADVEAREQIAELLQFMRDRIPGCERCQLVFSAPVTGVRESRMIDGEHLLTAEELIACTRFEDRIACGNYDIDIHNPEGSGTSHRFFPPGEYYTIPYRSLIPKDAENLLVAGRCISCTHEAQASIRIMPIVCTLGEAAGTAAAVALESGCSVKEIDVSRLQTLLREAGACIE